MSPLITEWPDQTRFTPTYLAALQTATPAAKRAYVLGTASDTENIRTNESIGSGSDPMPSWKNAGHGYPSGRSCCHARVAARQLAGRKWDPL